MDKFLSYLRDNLDLRGFTLIRTTHNKILVFKSFSKYSKCIYINVFKDNIEVNIDRVFDSKMFYPGIERLIISRKVFNNMDESLNYIQKNIVA